jgi:hypothetical protein
MKCDKYGCEYASVKDHERICPGNVSFRLWEGLVMNAINIREESSIWAILAYNNESNRPTWCIHTPPGSRIGGFSAKLVGEAVGNKDAWVIELANSDRQVVPKSEVYLRGRI